MAVDKLVDSAQLDSGLTQVANAIRTKGGTSESLAFPSGFVSAVESIPSGSATITDGIVIKARNADGFATSIDYYGTQVYRKQFWNRTTVDGTWIYLQSVNFENTVTVIKQSAFEKCKVLQSINLSNVETIEGNAFMECISLVSLNLPNLTSLANYAFATCTSLETIIAPKNINWLGGRLFSGCTALQTAQLGSVGYGVTGIHSEIFQNCTQNGLTITVFTTGSYVDNAVANVRNGATNAAIIIKASEATTYNGTSYAAGDTILTSEVA